MLGSSKRCVSFGNGSRDRSDEIARPPAVNSSAPDEAERPEPYPLLTKLVHRAYGRRRGWFSGLAFAITHRRIVENYDTVQREVSRAPEYMPHLERWKELSPQLSRVLRLGELLSLRAWPVPVEA